MISLKNHTFDNDDDTDDLSFNYDNALDITFEGSNDSDNFMEENMKNILDYDHDTNGTSKEQKHKGYFNESENDSEKFKNMC